MRMFRLIATPVLLLGLLGFLVWGASWGWRNLTAPLPSPSPTPCVTRSAQVITAANVSVRVFNGGFATGLAGRVAAHLRNNGFEVLRVANTDERVAETIIRGSAENEPALTLLQSHFRESVIQHDDRVDGSVDVLVGTTYMGVNPNPLPEVATEGGVTCEYPSPSPSPSPSASPGGSAAPDPSASPTS
ncbi:LytR cell envelope-related transcriptional attenuator [Tessaracoccus oleiagri]|uniref:LytR cell envelope-related transcriptional attenuator n=2 Tax=Tessaracoccus oleiagri TaxID=686624 RepID=A0A1G9HC28_9ACTN|nr:LytR cell envelope-related transcriptional attenuator [Tessaracoccus oleiagri]